MASFVRLCACVFALALLPSWACAQTDDGLGSPLDANPYSPLVRGHYYAQLRKSPTRVFLYELALPGLGFAYAGFKAQAVISAASSVLGASLWVAGGLTHRDVLRDVGIATFAAARVYGVVAAPTCAVLLNAAFRRNLGIRLAYAF